MIKRERVETFTVEDGHLVRTVLPVRGEPYAHRCPERAFELVTHVVDEFGDAAFTIETVVAREDLPFSQVAVALAFLRERGIIETRLRQNRAATQCAHLDAMTEYHALAANA